MSWEAVSWATKQKVGQSTQKLVLLCLSNYSDDNNKCYPSHKTISEFAEVGIDTVINAIKQLEVKVLISKQVRFVPTNNNKNRQTSNLYTLNITPLENQVGVHNPIPPSPKNPIQTNYNELKYNDEFNDWWNLYPRKAGSKQKAFILYLKITDKVIGTDELYTKTVQYKNSVHGQDQKFIPHPTTWLNGRRWEIIEDTKTKVTSINQLVG